METTEERLYGAIWRILLEYGVPVHDRLEIFDLIGKIKDEALRTKS